MEYSEARVGEIEYPEARVVDITVGKVKKISKEHIVSFDFVDEEDLNFCLEGLGLSIPTEGSFIGGLGIKLDFDCDWEIVKENNKLILVCLKKRVK